MKVIGSIGAAFAALLLSGIVHAEEQKGIRVEDFFGGEDMMSAEMSPSGKHVAWLQRNQDGRYILVSADTDDLSKAKAVAAYKNADIVEFEWVNDERLFMLASDVKNPQGAFGGEEYAVNRDGTWLRQLTSRSWDYHQEQTGSQIRTKILPPEYWFEAPLHDGSDSVIVRKYIYNNVDIQPEYSRLYRLDTKTLQLTDIFDGEMPAKLSGWVLDGDDKVRVGVAELGGREKVYYNDPEKKTWRLLGDFDAENNEGFWPHFVGFDGTLFVTAATNSQFSALYKYNLTENKLPAQPMLSIKGYDFTGHPLFDHTARKLVGIAYKNDAWNTAWLDPRMREMQQKIDAILPNTINRIRCDNCLAGPALLVASQSDRQPINYYLYDTAKGTITMLGSQYPKIDVSQMGERLVDRYNARDGKSIPIYVTMPANAPKGPKPTVVIVHGGPWVRGSSWEWDTEAQFLASRGYVVLQPEFRGSTGYGFDLFQSGWKQWGLSMQDDIADATKWAIAKGYTDPKRIAISGASYGGYATLMGLIRNPELFRAGFEFAGVTDIDLMFSSPEEDFTMDTLAYGFHTLIGDPKADAEKFKQNSAVANARKVTQPVLLAYGGRDRRVPMVHGIEFRDAVAKTNQNVEWLDYKNEGHGFRFDADRIDYYKHVETFLEKNLAPVN